MRFTKMNGAGNDFLVINNIEECIPTEQLPQIARTLCRRRFSVGADGLMAVEHPLRGGDFRMLFYNADGSPGEMCGNGARCICRYGYEKGLAGEQQTVETPSGLVIGRRIDQRNYLIRLTDPSIIDLDLSVEVDGVNYPCSYVELGRPGLPHAVVPIDNLADKSQEDLRVLGASLRHHPSFPKGANVNFYQLTGPSEVLALTYERGVEDFTLACGTGSGSLALVLTLKGLCKDGNVSVKVPGGRLKVSVEREGDIIKNLFLTGPTNIVAEGEALDEELSI